VKVVVDSSALVAIVNDEPERGAFSKVISEAEVAYCSAATIYETGIVLLRTKPGDDLATAISLAETFKLHIVPFTMEHAALALDAYRRYGKGRGARPHLNLGDCV
jgi:ribonuclease VapC